MSAKIQQPKSDARKLTRIEKISLRLFAAAEALMVLILLLFAVCIAIGLAPDPIP